MFNCTVFFIEFQLKLLINYHLQIQQIKHFLCPCIEAPPPNLPIFSRTPLNKFRFFPSYQSSQLFHLCNVMLNYYPTINWLIGKIYQSINQMKLISNSKKESNNGINSGMITNLDDKTDEDSQLSISDLSLNQSITSITQSEQNQLLQLTIKYAKLKSEADQQYHHYLRSSQHQIIILPPSSTKKYRIHVNATKDEYNSVIHNSNNSTQLTKTQSKTKIQLRFVNENLFRDIGDTVWKKIIKNQCQSHKYKILINRKQFRIDFNQFKCQQYLNNQVSNNKIYLNNKHQSQLSCIRILQNTYFHLSQHFQIICSKVHQLDQPHQKQQFLEIISSASEPQIDQFILSNSPSNNPQQMKYQVKLKMPIQNKIMEIGTIPELMNTYLGFAIESLYGLQKEEFDDVLEWEFFYYIKVCEQAENNMNNN